MGIEPTILRLTVARINHYAIESMVSPAGFEPAHPKIPELKSDALDHSAMLPRENKNEIILIPSKQIGSMLK